MLAFFVFDDVSQLLVSFVRRLIAVIGFGTQIVRKLYVRFDIDYDFLQFLRNKIRVFNIK